MINLTETERTVAQKVQELKARSGSHSPSLITLQETIPEVEIKVDACFLSNPYATGIFLDYFKRELLETGHIRNCLEFYPSQNQVIAEHLSEALGLPAKQILMGNGASELIQAVLHNFSGEKVLVNLPTFSSYYEFVQPPKQIVFNVLNEHEDFKLHPEQFLEKVGIERPDTVVIINPNNPDGGYLPYEGMLFILNNLKHLQNVIVDESFIHFAFEDNNFSLKGVAALVSQFPNLVVVKSMSKDFGIAGIRAGYTVMAAERVEYCLKHGFLWNVSGLAEYFFRLYARKDFWKKYEEARICYIKDAQEFFHALTEIEEIKVVSSMANFALVKILNDMRVKDLAIALLVRYGIHVRDCADKKGLQGEYLRLSARTKTENDYILNALREILVSRPFEWEC